MYPLKHNNKDARFQTIPQVARDYSVSENTIRRYAKECGAIRKLGRSVRIDREKFDKAMDLLTAVETEEEKKG